MLEEVVYFLDKTFGVPEIKFELYAHLWLADRKARWRLNLKLVLSPFLKQKVDKVIIR